MSILIQQEPPSKSPLLHYLLLLARGNKGTVKHGWYWSISTTWNRHRQCSGSLSAAFLRQCYLQFSSNRSKNFSVASWDWDKEALLLFNVRYTFFLSRFFSFSCCCMYCMSFCMPWGIRLISFLIQFNEKYHCRRKPASRGTSREIFEPLQCLWGFQVAAVAVLDVEL